MSDQYDRLIAFEAEERAKQQAADVAERTRRQLVYDAVYAATFARLRGWPTRASVENARHFADRDARVAASKGG